jgi:hypothetical protein
MDIELKPCPFCGQVAKMHRTIGVYFVGSSDDNKCQHYLNPMEGIDTPRKAAEMWNSRPVEDDLIAQLTAHNAALTAAENYIRLLEGIVSEKGAPLPFEQLSELHIEYEQRVRNHNCAVNYPAPK